MDRGPAISGAALQALLEKLDGLKEGDVLVLAGSIPASIPETIYAEIMKRLGWKRSAHSGGCDQ